jgi:hypothetical protein
MKIQKNTHTEAISANRFPFVQIESNIHLEGISSNKENNDTDLLANNNNKQNNGILTQKVNALKKTPHSLCPTKISDF